ncbi:MAG: restriction endonuclease subunit S [Verrucomicrobia bacterium]|nr:restriction endonuclease subunit S [Verrucomicrobiota bacterium]
MSDKLPQGWTTTSLSDLLIALESGSRPRGGVRGISGGVPSIGGEHLKYDGKFDFTSLKYVPEQFAASMTKGRIRTNDILVVKDGATTGKTAFVDSTFPFRDAVVNEHVFICRPRPEIEPRFLFRFLTSRDGQQHILENFKGSAQGGINQSFAPNTEVPLAPLGEQRRIVAKLETLLGKVDASQQRLAKIPVLLKHFRQSVLAAACSGRLTADWREENRVDDEWKTEPLSELFTMRNGKSLTTAKREDGEIPVYGGNGHMGNHNAANAEGQVIVIGRVGAQCGNVHFVSGKVWVTDNAISLEAKREVEPAFYAFFLRSKNLNQLSAGTGQPYVSQEILGPIETPVVSLAEQREIVNRVEALFALADQIEARFTQARAQVDQLTPSLLARAFRGELVPQDPADEPAATLLERLQQRQAKPRCDARQ